METTESRPVLELRAVSVEYRGSGAPVQALREVDLELRPGEYLAVMGPSGSGKSTLLNLAAGLLGPSKGTVEAFGRDLGALSDDGRALYMREKLGYVFQFFNLISSLSVRENIVLPLGILGRPVDEEWIGEIARLTRIEHRLGHRPSELSGGEMQRVSLARALAPRPKLLLADEPTGNVSSRDGSAILDLLGELHESTRMAVLLVTHNPRDASRSRRTVFLDEGRIREGAELRGDFAERDVLDALDTLGI